MKSLFIPVACLIIVITGGCSAPEKPQEKSPNFLLLLSDNHYYSHLGCYGDPVVKTPAIDQLASNGIRFENAFCASPSCTPARGALLTGQDIWRLGNGGNLWSSLSDTIPTYTDLLENAGYHVGHDRKGWGPGDYKAGGRNRNPAGYTFDNLEAFLNKKQEGQAWSFWLSSRNPHRPFEYGAGLAAGLDPDKVIVPPYLPDSKEVRSDICDYYYQIQQFDKEVAEAIELLKARNELENTFIMICGDNGWMMPRGLANLYDYGTRVPLIINWPNKIKQKNVVNDFVSLNDLAPTILDIAGIDIPEQMTARSLVPVLTATKTGRVEADRDFIVTARERHALVRKGGLGYPGRSIRTDDYLYIHNITPDRWPAGDPPLFGDIDLHMLQGKSPTKEYMMLNKDSPEVKDLYDQAFLKRPEHELFDLTKDPYQLVNVAYDSSYSQVRDSLISRMNDYLMATKDPRITGEPVDWDKLPYYKEKDWIGTPRKEARELFGLEESYSYY